MKKILLSYLLSGLIVGLVLGVSCKNQTKTQSNILTEQTIDLYIFETINNIDQAVPNVRILKSGTNEMLGETDTGGRIHNFSINEIDWLVFSKEGYETDSVNFNRIDLISYPTCVRFYLNRTGTGIYVVNVSGTFKNASYPSNECKVKNLYGSENDICDDYKYKLPIVDNEQDFYIGYGHTGIFNNMLKIKIKNGRKEAKVDVYLNQNHMINSCQ